ncbi:flavin-containing monooxygenase [Janibacter sp. G56]|uniref:flavin-containing monooxygenase n=1 Tax=Janibacter sp. G56 TaxID=3418717 RepID=UPI003D0478F5
MEHHDVVVVGAGLSGIGAACRLEQDRPGTPYVILERREAMGGTWDLFRYPGVRSDSDMYTLGYPFRPWQRPEAIASGEAIREYLHDTAAAYGVVDKVRFSTTVVAADWSEADARWTLTLRTPKGEERLSTSFLYLCAGYYDYERPHTPTWPGQEDFAGEVVHPQFWTDDIDHAGKRVVVIGSGATAVTLVPAMAQTATHVTMLQRSPTWMTIMSEGGLAPGISRVLPKRAAHALNRQVSLALNTGFYQLSRRSPRAAAAYLRHGLRRALHGDEAALREHFTPRYNVWDQRLCVVPNADLFRAMRAGTASVVTDTIDRFVPEGIRLTSGRVLEADLIVTATGLRMLAGGGVAITLDGEPARIEDRFVYRGTLLSGIPNAAICIGYINASWTLRSDLATRYVLRLLDHMREHGLAVARPRTPTGLEERPLLDLSSGYVERADGMFPKQGTRDPWSLRPTYALDRATMLRGDVTTEMDFVPART